MRVGSLCTGYGGIELGLALAGIKVDLRWIAENDPALRAVWAQPPVNLGDITAVDWSAVEPVGLLTAGFPCQPVSAAGRMLGDLDHRWQWPTITKAIDWLRPSSVLIENVRNLVSTQRGALWRGITDDLLSLGYGVRWLTLGACHVGAAHHRHRVFALAEYGTGAGVERVDTTYCGARGGAMLPTPQARDGDVNGRGEGDADYWARRAAARTNGRPLGAEVALLPTPQSRDGQGRGTPSVETAEARYAAGRRNLDDGLALLPTPTVGDSRNTRNATAGRSAGQEHHHAGTTLSDVAHGSMWGRFAEAVERHEVLYGPAPAPTEPNRNGAPRLAPAFAEWLMCLPAGHVTSVLDRRDALRAIGNGVCPPQLAAAWGLLNE